MNRLTREITRAMQPKHALIVYDCDDYYHDRYYLELHNINENGVMEAGKPVSINFIKSLVDNFSTEALSVAPRGEISKRLIYADLRQENYMWYSLPCRKYLYFRNSLNIPNGEYYIPGLVWKVKNSSLFLYAYNAKRLTTNAQLYSAPFFNVNPNNNSVCLGNASLKMPENLDFHNFLKHWEDMFFLSEFSHISGSNPTKTNLVLVVKNSTNTFDNNELLPIKKLKLKTLLK